MTDQVSSQTDARTESEVFEALRLLCARPGFVHALAHICWRDKTINYLGAITADDLMPTYSRDRLIRTETAVLIGLMVQQPLAMDAIDAQTLQTYVSEADALLAEMHEALNAPITARIRGHLAAPGAADPLPEGAFLRESIFYAAESAYFFQFRDFAPLRYGQDDEWLARHKGFTMAQAQSLVTAVSTVLNEQLVDAIDRYVATQDHSAILSAFVVRSDAVKDTCGAEQQVVDKVLGAFTLTTHNENYRVIDDYNEASTFPLLPIEQGAFLVFDTVALYQSLYESPIFWMRADDAYKDVATKHRGDFTESFAQDLLRRVFGADRVHTNVRLVQGKDTVDEIDVLVVYGDRLIVLQAKSKGLTIEARKGNNLSIRKDFQAAVAAAYAQALSSAAHLVAQDVQLVLADGNPLTLKSPIKEVFPFCVIADHYPSLSNQTRSLLKAQTTDVIREPFVMDVFLLDAMTEMLTSPLRLLGYVKQRALVFEKILVGHELTALSFHLKGNLWLDDEVDMVWLGDDISADLDVAMMVRRLGMPGDAIPEGILTRFRDTPYERLVSELEHAEVPVAIELGFLLLTMGLKTINGINRAIGMLSRGAKRDRRTHDFTIGLGRTGDGLTVHIGDEPNESARQRLIGHCELKKNQQRSSRWFGIALDPGGKLRFAVAKEEPWQPSAELDAAAEILLPMVAPSSLTTGLASLQRVPKLGVNDPCPCGSNKKYKKCCMWRE